MLPSLALTALFGTTHAYKVVVLGDIHGDFDILMNILKNKTKNSNLGCIVISHRSEILEELTETFDRVLTVQKSGNTTKLLDETDT